MADTVLVTGSSRGIGKAIALRLAEGGYELVVHYRKQKAKAAEVVSLIKKNGGAARLLEFDVTDRAEAATALAADIEQYGAYYGVVCNAGITQDTAFPAMTEEQWDGVINTNLNSFYNVLHPVIMPMVRRRKPGRIVTLASTSGQIGNRGQTNYSAAKGGVIAATKSLALELAKREITVNSVAPGLIETDMTQDVPQEALRQMIPARRAGKAEEVAAAVAFLMSCEAAYITRQVIAVNGGLC